MSISFVASNPWTSNTFNSSFTLEKPTGTASGDFMVAILAIDTFNSSGGNVTVTPPSGWTSEGHIDAAPNLVIDVMTRPAGASEPSTWTGSLGGSENPKCSIVATYRGVAGIAIDGITESQVEATSLNTATINNPAADNWRIVAGAYASASVSSALNSNEVTKRDSAALDTVEAGIWDSNGTIASGNTSRNVTRSVIWESAAVWIAALDAGETNTDAPAGLGSVTGTSNKPNGGAGAKPTVIG